MMASSQSYDFSSSHVRMWELDHEEGCCCSVAQSCLTVYKPMDCSTVLGFPVLHHLPELAQTYVHWVIMGPLWCSLKVSDAIQPCHLLLPPSLPSVFPRIRVISSETALHIRWPKYGSFSFGISPSNEYSGSTSFRIDWFDHLAAQGTLKSLLQHCNSESSILQHSVIFMMYMTTVHITSVHDYWKTIALTIQTFVSKVMSIF